MTKPLASPKVLLTCFDPFGGEKINASLLATEALRGKQISKHHIVLAELQTVFGESLEKLRRLIAEYKPALVICVGQAPRAVISQERVAINLMDANMPDNRGFQPSDQAIIANGPVGYFSTLPVKAMRDALKKADIPAEISQSAGNFVCNSLFYGLMHELATRKSLRHIRGGFIHVPLTPEQIPNPAHPSMPLDMIVNGLRLSIKTAIEEPVRKQINVTEPLKPML